MHGFPIAGRIAGEIGFVNLATVGLPARCVMIGTLTAGQFFVFDIVMDLTGAAKFHFHGVWPFFLPLRPLTTSTSTHRPLSAMRASDM